MNSKLDRLEGPWNVTSRGVEGWRLTHGKVPAHQIEFSLGAVEPAAAEPAVAPVTDTLAAGADAVEAGADAVEIEWLESGARVTLHRGAYAHSLRATRVVVHAPLPDLFDALPLSPFDEADRTFWRRVFRIVRLPGGRWLLKVVARRRAVRD